MDPGLGAGSGEAPVLAYIGLGANLGDLALTLRQALRSMAALPQCRLVAVSGAYRSAPIEAGGPDYLNAVALLHTTLPAVALLQALQLIELQHGRERPYVNAPRTLDLDLLLYGQETIDSAHLTVPHPRLCERAFVLHPLLELAEDLRAPGFGALAAFLPAVAGQIIERLPLSLSDA
ncbi:2-amino-4-hydroxy-6-hydroxymethyldihydropteridine diphosphokinase [Roseateles sp.]|uniref:2-amino-4-hydroxy-6- hydroxymethyldihydropteridine diphosphokinase n=1 Tax=Roseateles sp. TaxID=1971397 RepID=UPI003BA5B202